MRKVLLRRAIKLNKNHKRRVWWQRIVRAMSMVVVFCTTYALILPAITMQLEPICGLESHTHGEGCYVGTETLSFTCTPGESVLHTHEDRCFDRQGNQICPHMEKSEHTHTADCYADQALICGREEVQAHSHGEACVDESGALVCTMPVLSGHVHSQDCVVAETTQTLVCTLTEHTHDALCVSDPKADVETREIWDTFAAGLNLTGNWGEDLVAVARTQIGYQESDRNFQMEADGVRKGYTRYGAWYGVPYGSWDAMFVSFCLHYAGIPEEAIPYQSNSKAWFENLKTNGRIDLLPDAQIAPGDVAFFGDENNQVAFAAIITEATRDMTESEDPALYLQIIAGDASDEVVFTNVTTRDSNLLGVISLEKAHCLYDELLREDIPAETTQETLLPEEIREETQPEETVIERIVQTAETENYIVTVSYSADVVLPEGAQLQVLEYAKDSEIYRRRCDQAGYELEWLLNIGFFLGEEEMDVRGGFDVVVTGKQGQSLGSDITHFADSGPEHIEGQEVTEDGQSAVAFTSETFSDFGGGVAVTVETGSASVEAMAAGSGYQLVTANPNELKENTNYVIYTSMNGGHIFLTNELGNYDIYGARRPPLVRVQDNQSGNNRYNIGGVWEQSDSQITNLNDITWRVVKNWDSYYLVSQRNNQRLALSNGWMFFDGNGTGMTNSNVSGAATYIGARVDGRRHEIRLDEAEGGFWSVTWWNDNRFQNSATTLYFAEITEKAPSQPDTPVRPGYPEAVHTGTVDIPRLRFYNICEDGDNGVSALAGCVFEIVGDNGYRGTVTSGNVPEVNLPEGLPDGNYTITEISAPKGYMRDTDFKRTFTVQNHALVADKTIGTFINHDTHQLNAVKTGEVEDYNNRIYEILLSAENQMRIYEMDPVDVLFVVDQSNSMLFPSGLNDTGKRVTLRLDAQNNISNMNNLGLDRNQVYYIISDPAGTSTVWAVWYNGGTWLYQDASYYAKAWHENDVGYKDPNETAIFPTNRSYQSQADNEDGEHGGKNVRANGGGLGHSLSGSSLGKYIDTLNGDVGTFTVYTARTDSNGVLYNRLHYLEEALTNMIYTLADVNDQNRVTITEFTKEVKPEDDLGPLTLSPDNVETLIGEVQHINTSGGTRQDIALKHVYNNHLNNANDHYSGNPNNTYTILITDGAPVLSSSNGEISNLGSPNDGASTTSNSVYAQIKGYAQLVRGKSTLMTVGLGMGDVVGGKQVLQEIASGGNFNCALDDASELVVQMQRIMFDAFRPKEMIHVTADVVDEISDSFYPIAYTASGAGQSTGRRVLVQNNGRDWIQLQAGDWINLEGGYTTAGAADAAGQLLRKEDGTYYIQWKNIGVSNPYSDLDPQGVAWVPAGSGKNTGRTVLGTYGNRDWIQLNSGDWIDQQGQYYAGTPNSWNRRNYGQVSRNSDGSFRVAWGSSANGNNRALVDILQLFDGWNGIFYVKAKEDFIGGNAIDTNKMATIAAQTYIDDAPSVTVDYETPTVNVRLLGMNEMHSEVTVYLGDLINREDHTPLDSLKGFYNDTVISKLIAGSDNTTNKFGSVTVTEDGTVLADGLEEAEFYLRYAMGYDLTDAQWQKLIEGETVTVPYLYDNPSSHGSVGAFTFRMEKTGITGANPDYAGHEATAACQPGGNPLTENCEEPAETYTLYITYEAYGLGEDGRPGKNVHNGTGSPGTEVGTGSTLPTGLGTLEKENIHEVHVISGSIKITKKFTEGLTHEADRTFAFTLHRVEDGEDTSQDVTKTITIPAGQSAGASGILFDGLRRGSYTVTEALDELYTVGAIAVQNTTNCYSEPAIGSSDVTLLFTMGNNPSNENVIGYENFEAVYTSYIDPVKGVFGEAVFTNREITYTGDVPVQKVWDDGLQAHEQDAVYLALYLNDVPVQDADGRHRLLRLDQQNNWQGEFKVVLADKNDKVTNYNYSVREVSQVSDDDSYRDGWHKAVLENDGSTLYYAKALEDGNILGVRGRGYMVRYTAGENSAWMVTNYRTVELPQTGGMGTHLYTFSGLLTVMAALMCGCSQRRKRERGAGR